MRIIALKILFLILSVTTFAQTAKVPERLANISPLERKVNENVNFYQNTVSDVLMRLFSDTFSIGGIAVLSDNFTETKFIFNPQTRTLKDILDSIVEAEPLYKWEMKDGLINLVPKKNYPVLETKINKFYIYNATKEEMIEILLRTPEFQSAIKESKVESEPYYCCGGACTRKPQRNTINMQNSTVQEILNEIVRLNGRSAWTYREYSANYNNENKRFYNLSFLVNFGADCDKYEN